MPNMERALNIPSNFRFVLQIMAKAITGHLEVENPSVFL
jgi:hypothetical protein